MFSELITRLRAIFRRKAVENELDDELRFHFEQQVEKLIHSGVSLREARRRARLIFGGAEHIKEECRDARGVGFLETLVQDTRHAFRMLRRSPGFTFVAILTLALGIGANTAIFSVINSVLLQPLPFHDPDRLVRIFSFRGSNAPVSGEDYFDWQSQNHTFEQMSLLTGPQNLNASGAFQPETVAISGVQSNFLSVLGVQPETGREFATTESSPGSNRVALLSYGFCQRHFGDPTAAVGKTVRLNFQPYTVVGIMPRTFRYPEGVDIWIPLEMTIDHLSTRGNYSYRVLGRMKPGIAVAQAQADMSAIAKNLEDQFPVSNGKLGAHVVPIKDLFSADSKPQLLILLGAVALVLLVACANVANLLLARATARHREMALRATLGANRWRLIRQLLTESMLLSVFGAAAGLAGAWWLVKLAQSAKTLPMPRQNPIQIDATVLLVTLAISLIVGVLFGLAPAVEASSLNLNDALKSNTAAVAGTSGWRLVLRSALVIGEVTISLALLIGAGLLLRSFAHMRSADIGVRTQNILTAAVVLPDTKYKTSAQRREFYETLLDRIQHAPLVAAASISQQIPLEGSHGGSAKLQGATDNGLFVNWNFVTTDYFRIFGIRFLSGRKFTSQDIDRAAQASAKFSEYFQTGKLPSSPQPDIATIAVVNQAMASSLWPGQDAVGKIFFSSLVQPVTVVGVVSDERYDSLRGPATPIVYFPFTQELNNKWYPAELIVQSAGAPSLVVAGVRSVVHDLDSELSLFRVRSMNQVIADNMEDTSLQTLLLGAFAGLGLLLSAVGIYGVLAYLVVQRTREIGLRMALGAQPREILQLIMSRGAKLIFAGLVIGALLALGLTRLLANELFGVTPNDPLTYIGVSILLTAVAMAACYIPARRATRVDPLVALRYE